MVLCNAGGANSFRNAVRRRFMEVLFDARPEAMDDLTAALAHTEETLALARALIRPQPEPAWMNPLLGRYASPALGAITLSRRGKRFLIDVGEWKGEVSQKVDRDGTKKVAVTSAPWGSLGGLELIPRSRDGTTILVLDAGQQVYEFVRAAD